MLLSIVISINRPVFSIARLLCLDFVHIGSDLITLFVAVSSLVCVNLFTVYDDGDNDIKYIYKHRFCRGSVVR